MISRASKLIYRFVSVILLVTLSACVFKTQTLNASNVPIPTETLSVEVATVVPQNTPTSAVPLASPITRLLITPTLPLVTVTALNGNLYIRRGSGSDFNPIGVLAQGQTAAALGRDILGKWLYIPIPSENGKFGWVSTLTIYSSVGGSMMDLPVVDSDLAIPAFIQNCSTHNMIVQPADVILPPWYEFPNNIVQFDPGEYTIHDYDSANRNNQGMVIDLSEGEQLQITAMGTPAQHKCPVGQ
ncbi:MAG: SH3 domain-containing protein [Anaerolineales bacterium]